MQFIKNKNNLNKAIFIETYGCQMNEADTEIIKSILSKANYSFVPEENDADIIMLNTCAIREHAHRKVYGRVHEILHKRRKREERCAHRNLGLYGHKSASGVI